MRKVRVLHILNSFRRGGIETFVYNLFCNADSERFEFEFLISDHGGAYEQAVVEKGGRIHRLAPRCAGRKAYWHNLDEFFKSHKGEFDAVHHHTSWMGNLEPLRYAKKYGVPVRIVHSHTAGVGEPLYFTIKHRMGQWLARRWVTHALGCSEKACKYMFAHTGMLDETIVINNGIDMSKFYFSDDVRRRARKSIGIAQDDLVVGHVGRFATTKNHKFLIDIFGCLLKINHGAKLVLVGTGDLQDEIKYRITQLGIGDKALMLGDRSDVNELLQAMDIFVMPSIFEGLPVSLVEAQTAGLPVLCSDTVSPMTKILPSLKFKPLGEGAEAWAQEIVEMTASPSNRDMRELLTDSDFNIQCTLNQLYNIYTSVDK